MDDGEDISPSGWNRKETTSRIVMAGGTALPSSFSGKPLAAQTGEPSGAGGDASDARLSATPRRVRARARRWVPRSLRAGG